jgi:hypothetical protein
MSTEQAEYLGLPQNGPYKPDHYVCSIISPCSYKADNFHRGTKRMSFGLNCLASFLSGLVLSSR